MSSPFGDDDKFPDRPDTLDFWRLSQVTLKLDGAMQAGVPIEDTMVGVVDEDSLMYLASQRSEQFIFQSLKDGSLSYDKLRAMLVSAFMTGLVTGIEFQKEGGHRDG